jgi:hypothetical protein
LGGDEEEYVARLFDQETTPSRATYSHSESRLNRRRVDIRSPRIQFLETTNSRSVIEKYPSDEALFSMDDDNFLLPRIGFKKTRP